MAAKKTVKAKPVAKAGSIESEVSDGLRYPWGHARRLWNILWALLPILGWLALLGYVKKITNALVKGDKAGLPEFGSFSMNMKEGFWVFVKMIPLMIVVMVVQMVPLVGWLAYMLLAIFFVPYLAIHFLVRGDFAATFDYKAVIEHVFGNLKDYAVALLKTIVFYVVYFVLSFVLVGIPCLYFGSCFYLAEFYANNH